MRYSILPVMLLVLVMSCQGSGSVADKSTITGYCSFASSGFCQRLDMSSKEVSNVDDYCMGGGVIVSSCPSANCEAVCETSLEAEGFSLRTRAYYYSPDFTADAVESLCSEISMGTYSSTCN
jgi:hypothetical protein